MIEPREPCNAAIFIGVITLSGVCPCIAVILVNIGGGGSSGKSNGGDEVADGDVLVEGDETRGDGGTGT